MEENNIEIDKNKKKNTRNVTIFAILLSVVSIGVLVFGFTLVSSDKVIMKQSISNLFNKISNSKYIDTSFFDKLSKSKDVGMKGNISFDDSNDSVSLRYDINQNISSNKTNFDFSLLKDKEDLLSGNYFIDGKKLYFFFKNITPEYYSTDLDESFTSFNFNMFNHDDIDKLISIFKEAISDSIDKDELTKEKVTLKYDGSDKKVNKITYKVDANELKEIIKNFVKELKNDKKLINSISESMGLDSEQFVATLDLLASFAEFEDKEYFTYSTYYYGFNKIVKYELDIDNMYNISCFDEKNKSTFSFSILGNDYFNIIFNDIKNGKEFNGKIKSLTVDNFDEYSKDYDVKEYDLEFSGLLKDDYFELKIGDYKLITKSENDGDKYKSVISLYTTVDKKEELLFEIKVDLELYYNKKIDVDVSDSKDVNELTEDDLNTINENLMNIPFFKELNSLGQDNLLLENSI